MVYKCIKEFEVDKCDDDGFSIENEIMVIEEGSHWEFDEDLCSFTLVRIDGNSNSYYWIEIDDEILENYFECIK